MTDVATGNSDSAELAVAAAAAGAPARRRKGLGELVETNMEEIAKALPPGVMEPERFGRIVLTEFRKTPKLLTCTPESFLGALFQTAQLGLEPGGQLGHAFLIPYDNSRLECTECQLQIGYKGWVELGGRRGIMMRAREVRENDRFDFDLGSNEHLHHDWKLGTDRGEVIGYWGKVVMPDGKVTFTVMDKSEINARKNRSSAVRSGRKGPWDTDYDAMARKTVIRAMVPQVALAPELQTALKADEAIIERNAAGDLSYAYRNAIDTSVVQLDSSSPTKDELSEAINAIADNHQRIACSKYLLDNFGSIESVTEQSVPAMLKIAQEWPAVLERDSAPVKAQTTGELFGDETEAIFSELGDQPDVAADARVHLETWRSAQPEAPSDDASALELERWLHTPADEQTPAQTPQEPAEAPAGADAEPPPSDPQGAAPGGVSPEIQAKVQAVLDTWDFATVKQKLREFGQMATGAEKVCRLRLLTTLAPLYAAGEPAVTGLVDPPRTP